MTRFMKFSLLGAALAVPATSAFATSITAGQTVTAQSVSFSNSNMVASTSGTLSPTPNTYSGTYTEFVYRDSSNTVGSCAGQCLTFVIRVTDTTGSADAIERVSTSIFSSAFLYNVGYSDSNGRNSLADPVNPLFINDSASGVIGFDFSEGTGIMPGSTSAFLVIQTNATNYVPGTITTQDGGVAAVPAFMPSAATPEPSSLMLLGTGMLSAAGVAFRKRKVA